MKRTLFGLTSFLLGLAAVAPAQESGPPLRAGIIGCDTSHAIAFTKAFNSPKEPGSSPVRVVAAFPGGSPDIPASSSRVAEYVKKLRDEYQVQIVDSIDALLGKVDVVLLESVDGRPHLEQFKPVVKAGKPTFIDKPVAGSLADAVEVFQLAHEANLPVFSSSGLRFSPGIAAAKDNPKTGAVLGCAAYSPCHLEPHHPDLFWYGVHGVETLFTVMGTGCETVTRAKTATSDVTTCVWKDGRVGTYRGLRAGKEDYGATVFGSKGIAPTGGFAGYEPLVVEIGKFFRTRRPPVSAEETLEIFAFMEAADESVRRGGAPVKIDEVMAKARAEVARRTQGK
jgi:predicted dehydrogenase